MLRHCTQWNTWHRAAWRTAATAAQPVLVPRPPVTFVHPPLAADSPAGHVYDASSGNVPEMHADHGAMARVLLLRQCAIDVAAAQTGDSVLLDGPPGAGKSAQLIAIHALLHAHGRPSFYIPSLRRVVSGAEPYTRLALNAPSASNTASPPSSPTSCIPAPAAHQSAMPPSHSSIASDFEMPELAARLANRMQSQAPDLHTAIAGLPRGSTLIIDDANALFSSATAYRDEQGNLLASARFAALDALRAAISSGHVRVIGATHRTDAAYVATGLAPEALSAWPTRVVVPPLDASEVRALLQAHVDTGRVVATISRYYVDRMRFATSGLPGRLLPTSDYDAVYSPAGPRGISRK